MPKIFSLLIALFLFLPPRPSFAFPLASLKVISVKGEKFAAKLLIDFPGKEIKVEIGSRQDYFHFNLIRPEFIEDLYVNIPRGLYEENKKVVYILSRSYLIPQKFYLVLRADLRGKKYLKKFLIIWEGKEKNYPLRLKRRARKKAVPPSGRINFLPSTVSYQVSYQYFLSSRGLKLSEPEQKVKGETQFHLIYLTFVRKLIIIDQFYLKLGLAEQKFKDKLKTPASIISSSGSSVEFNGAGRFLYGGGLSKKLIATKDAILELNLDIFSFNNQATDSSSEAKLDWLEYQIGGNLNYRRIKFIQPYLGLYLSSIAGSFKFTETQDGTGQQVTHSTGFSASELLGIKTGLNIRRGKFALLLETRFLTQTGYRAGISYSF